MTTEGYIPTLTGYAPMVADFTNHPMFAGVYPQVAHVLTVMSTFFGSISIHTDSPMVIYRGGIPSGNQTLLAGGFSNTSSPINLFILDFPACHCWGIPQYKYKYHF